MKNKINNYSGRNFKRRRRPDKLSKKARSILMSKIRSKDSSFERDFIGMLSDEITSKFQTNVASIKGKPDIVFKRQKLCIFLDSDFWHGWQLPRWQHLLKNEYWKEKVESNRKRDSRIKSYLTKKGWIVLRLWEHAIKRNQGDIVAKIKKILRS